MRKYKIYICIIIIGLYFFLKIVWKKYKDLCKMLIMIVFDWGDYR